MTRWIAAVAFVVSLPGVGAAQLRLGAPAAALETTYKTEHAWAIGEIVADINEMARYRGKQPPAAPFTETISPWHPELLTAYAASQLASGPTKQNDTDPADQNATLLTLSLESIIKANAIVSASLKRDMRNPRAHEAAAMILAAFGLRESAGGMSDVRWTLNRITAHLAIAQALRGAESRPSADGQLAYAIFLALSDRQRTALASIDTLPATPAMAPWQRALKLRVTQDWRMLASPATATRVEKLEYFRARRATVRGTRGGQDLTDMREPIALDFARILQARAFGVEDGQEVVFDGLVNEVGELALAYKLAQQKDLPKELPAAIVNARAGRLLANGEPQVIPWGAWAEFSQRHIGMSIEKVDSHYRRRLGTPDVADQMKADLDRTFGHFTLYAVASTGRTKGKKGTEADLTHIARAIDVAVRSPELVTFDFWKFIENGSNYEPVKRGMPAKKTWFAPLSVDVPYDAGLRAEALIGYLKPPQIEALLDEAPHNIGLLSRVAQRYRMLRPLIEKVRTLYGPRVEYDMWAIDSAINVARDPDDRVALRRRACALAVNQCIELASEMIATDEAGAAAEYEKAFRNPALDEIAMSRASAWLVGYYERHGELIKAMDLAQRSAATWSSRGLLTFAQLLERRARLEEADEVFSNAARRYPDNKTELAAFLYRQAIGNRRQIYLARWQAAERELFPNGGLQPMAATMPAKPANGVFVEEDSYWSMRVRLQAGDIIVGVDGYKVENLEQYQTIVAFLPPGSKHKFTAWRGVLFTVDLTSWHGMVLKTHPLKGWIE